MSITRTLAAALAAAALAAPVAQAAPIDNGPVVPHPRDLRSADARASESESSNQWSGASAAESASIRPQPQPSAPAPAADGGDGVDGLSVGLGAAGALLAVSGLAVVNGRRRQRLGATA